MAKGPECLGSFPVYTFALKSVLSLRLLIAAFNSIYPQNYLVYMVGLRSKSAGGLSMI